MPRYRVADEEVRTRTRRQATSPHTHAHQVSPSCAQSLLLHQTLQEAEDEAILRQFDSLGIEQRPSGGGAKARALSRVRRRRLILCECVLINSAASDGCLCDAVHVLCCLAHLAATSSSVTRPLHTLITHTHSPKTNTVAMAGAGAVAVVALIVTLSVQAVVARSGPNWVCPAEAAPARTPGTITFFVVRREQRPCVVRVPVRSQIDCTRCAVNLGPCALHLGVLQRATCSAKWR